MKTITICDKEYEIDCNAFTQVQYRTIFKSKLIKDMHEIKEYLIKQTVVSNQVDTLNLDEAGKLSKISDYMSDDIDDFIIKITQILRFLLWF